MASLLKAAVLGKRKRCYSKKQTPLMKKKKKSKKVKHALPKACSEGEKISNFTTWCEQVGLKLHPSIAIGRHGSCSDIGVVATDDILKDDCLAVIPRSALLSCATSSINGHVVRDKVLQQHLRHCSSWVPLLVALLAEYSSGSSSNWHPYLSLVPSSETALPPMLWGGEERARLLVATGVQQRVENDLERINQDFTDIVLPFIKRHPQQFKKTLHSRQIYHKLVSFVMSYSFTDAGEADVLQHTMMVPFVDLLNHSSDHHVELAFGRTALRLMAIRNIKKGEEIMNTYGPLPNASLLQKYGFTEADNPHDLAYIPSSTVHRLSLKCEAEETLFRAGRWQCLESEGLLDEDYAIDKRGLPEDSLLILLRLLCSDQRSFEQLRERLLLSSSDNDSDSENPKLDVSPETMSKEELHLLKRLVDHCLALFPESYEANLATARSCMPMTSREKYSLLLCIGQQCCFTKTTKLTL